MTTLRRELRIKISDILGKYLKDTPMPDHLATALVDELADAMLERPKIDLSKTDPAWAILAGEQVDTTDSILVYEAKNAFERDMKFGALPWSSTRVWEKFENFVVQEFQKDKLIFTKYKTWQQNEGKFQAMSNRKIKERPDDFIACWPDFLAHSAMSAPKTTDNRDGWELDDHGAPISYV